jgi:hypothetical protein
MDSQKRKYAPKGFRISFGPHFYTPVVDDEHSLNMLADISQ